jgi:hypothetical protein
MALLAVSILTVLGHVCAVPQLAHAAFLPSEEADHGDAAGHADAFHDASCEATVTKAVTAGLSSTDSFTPVDVASGHARIPATPTARAAFAKATAPPARPPLFLLHATFLI